MSKNIEKKNDFFIITLIATSEFCVYVQCI